MYQESLAQIRTFIERNRDAAGVAVERRTVGEDDAYRSGKADAYAHVLSLLAFGRVSDESQLAALWQYIDDSISDGEGLGIIGSIEEFREDFNLWRTLSDTHAPDPTPTQIDALIERNGISERPHHNN